MAAKTSKMIPGKCRYMIEKVWLKILCIWLTYHKIIYEAHYTSYIYDFIIGDVLRFLQ